MKTLKLTPVKNHIEITTGWVGWGGTTVEMKVFTTDPMFENKLSVKVTQREAKALGDYFLKLAKEMKAIE